MKCRELQQKLSDWSDNALAADDAKAVEQHLRECPDCAAAQKRLAALKGLLSLKRHEHPESVYLKGMLDEFHRRLEAQRSARRAARWARFDTIGLQHWWERTRRLLHGHPLLALRYGVATALAMALILNAAIFALHSRTNPPTPPPNGSGKAMANSPTYMLEHLPSSGGSDAVLF